MKIITVNLPISDIKKIKKLVGVNGLYPSRSELIRVALRDFLVQELDIAKSFETFIKESKPPIRTPPIEENDCDYVRIPLEKTVGLEKITEWKTYKIISKTPKESEKPKTLHKVEPIRNTPLGNIHHPNGTWKQFHEIS